MSSVHHFPEFLQGAQHGIGNLVVASVVAVAGEALGNGVQVQNGGAQRGNVIHLLSDALEVAAVEVVVQHSAVGSGLPEDFFIPVVVDHIGLQLSGEVAITGFAEPIGEHLINGGTFGPVGGVEIGGNTADLP